MSDVLVVGSGASGVNAAVPLVEAGLDVTLIDYGNVDQAYGPIIPSLPFTEIRKTDPNQHRYFLGDRFEGIPYGKFGVGAQLTPPRLHISADTDERMPLDSDSFTPTESLALGGLAAGWGAASFPFDEDELSSLPISRSDLAPHYEAVARRIGISGDRDDLLPFLGECEAMMAPAEIDTNARRVLDRYTRSREKFNAAGFYLGRTRLALCTEPRPGREPHAYHDMDFWSDEGRSVYRPAWTLDELSKGPHFTYLNRRFVLSFAERGEGGVEVSARNVETGELETHTARALILAAGTLSTARIVLRSLGLQDKRVPIVSNPYTYVPVINLGMLGRVAQERRHSLAQIVAFYRPSESSKGVVCAQFYSYRSLLTFKLLKEVPLPRREALRVMRSLMPLFGIFGIFHEDHPTSWKYCVLHASGSGEPDRLEVRYELSPEEEGIKREHERRVLRFFRRLRCLPIKSIHPGNGSSIHYAGTFPMSGGEDELTCDADCRLRAARSVYLADGSVFPHLPAKGLTFTMMANANRVGAGVAERLKRPSAAI